MGELKETLLWCTRKGIVLQEGSQASPVRPSDKGIVKVMMVINSGLRQGSGDFDFLK
jgi:hypothetical protein